MKLSAKVRYAVKILVDIALEKEKPLTISSIAKRENISNNYLRQLVMLMVQEGILKTLRGKNGGVFLAKEPKDITVYELYRLLEGELFISDCLKPIVHCESSHNKPCFISDIWNQVNKAVIQVLNTMTLADILEKGEGYYNV